jgi:hypothetical protein
LYLCTNGEYSIDNRITKNGYLQQLNIMISPWNFFESFVLHQCSFHGSLIR